MSKMERVTIIYSGNSKDCKITVLENGLMPMVLEQLEHIKLSKKLFIDEQRMEKKIIKFFKKYDKEYKIDDFDRL